MLEPYLRRWNLVSDGRPIATHSSDLLPVRSGDTPAMLKVARGEEERRGASLMAWWDGTGAARVLAHHGDAILLERATGRRSLTSMAHQGHDDEASRIICGVAAKLHVHHGSTPATLVPLSNWCAELSHAAGTDGGIFTQAAATAGELVASPQEVCVLHGDLHHGNVLDFGERGWLAIDPKGLIGDRGFDFADILCNPDSADCDESGAHGSPDRCGRRSGPARPGATAALGLRLRRILRGMDHRRGWRPHSRFDHGTHGSS